MYTLLIVIHLMVAFLMIGVILIQSGKGAEIGAAFGGSSQTLFGGRGAATFLSKVTVVAAALFFATSLSLAIMSKSRSIASIVDRQKPSAGAAAPAQPGAAPGQAPGPAAPFAPSKP